MPSESSRGSPVSLLDVVFVLISTARIPPFLSVGFSSSLVWRVTLLLLLSDMARSSASYDTVADYMNMSVPMVPLRRVLLQDNFGSEAGSTQVQDQRLPGLCSSRTRCAVMSVLLTVACCVIVGLITFIALKDTGNQGVSTLPTAVVSTVFPPQAATAAKHSVTPEGAFPISGDSFSCVTISQFKVCRSYVTRQCAIVDHHVRFDERTHIMVSRVPASFVVGGISDATQEYLQKRCGGHQLLREVKM